MSNTKIAKILSGIVLVLSIMVMTGWIFEVPLLTSILPHAETMKFTAALSFALSGTSLFFIANFIEGKTEIAKVVLPMTSLIILLIMSTFLFSVLIGVSSGIEELFIRESENAANSNLLGTPSVGSMINFILLGTSGIFTLSNPKKLRVYLSRMGWIVGLIGGLAILGYTVKQEILYYSISNLSNAMAFHTALLFTLLGVDLIFLARKGQIFKKLL